MKKICPESIIHYESHDGLQANLLIMQGATAHLPGVLWLPSLFQVKP